VASNTTLNSGTGGDVITTKERTHDGDATKQQVVSLAYVTGTEGAYTHTDAAAGAGAVSAGVPRVTLASDDPAVTALQIIDNAISGSGINVSQLNGVNVTMGNGASGTGVQRVTLANDSTGVIATVSTVTNVATIGTSVTPGTGAAHLGKAEDAAHGSGDTGVMALAVRRDADTTLADTTGDYAPLQVNASGSLKVAITSGAGSGGTSIADGATFTRDTTSVTLAAAAVESSAPTLTNGDAAALSMTTGGALRVSVASGGIAGIVDDAAFTPATSEVLPIGFTFDNTSPDSVDEGDIGAARMSANRNIYVNIRDNAGNERGLNIDASGQLAANVAQINGVTVLMGNGASGTGAQRVTLANDSTGVLATVGTLTNITNWGNVVDDAAFTPATTRVLMVGYQADETATDSVDEGDGGAARMSLDRKQYTIAHQETGSIYQNGTARTPVFAAISGNTSGDNTLVAAAGASNKIRVTSLYLVAAGTTTVRFESGAGGTALSGVMSLIANTGFVLPHNPNGWFETAANTLLNMELNAAIQVSGGLSYIVVT
jgi:hypothetical protein